MAFHLVVGAGGIGRATAHHLAAMGDDVTLVSRSGPAAVAAPGPGAVRGVAADATDAAALSELARGARSIVNAVNPRQYHQWPRDWPPVARALLEAARRSGAGLVTVSNLYGYGEVTAPMRETDPLHAAGEKGEVRARMWRDALAAHEAGQVRATELRASDYFGPDAGSGVSLLNTFVLSRAVRGRSVWLVTGVPDAPHSWTYLDDIGVLAARLATDDRGWGRVWHVPTAPPRSFAEVAADVARVTGRPVVPVRAMPRAVRALARVSPTVRALDETAYQFQRPFVLDSTLTERTFGLRATPWYDALATTATALAPR